MSSNNFKIIFILDKDFSLKLYDKTWFKKSLNTIKHKCPYSLKNTSLYIMLYYEKHTNHHYIDKFKEKIEQYWSNYVQELNIKKYKYCVFTELLEDISTKNIEFNMSHVSIKNYSILNHPIYKTDASGNTVKDDNNQLILISNDGIIGNIPKDALIDYSKKIVSGSINLAVLQTLDLPCVVNKIMNIINAYKVIDYPTTSTHLITYIQASALSIFAKLF